MSTADTLYHELAARIVGQRVEWTRIFLFTLQVYFAPEGSEQRGFEIWCEPCWHIRTAAGIVTGSGTIEGPNTFNDNEEMERASATITKASNDSNALVGERLVALRVDTATHALEAAFSNGVVISTFFADPDESALWVLRDPARGLAVRGTPRGIATGTRHRDA